MPYVSAAAERGDPRAQYLVGIAHFNGDLAAKDWVRAYALLTLANGAGLPQAVPAIRQMDEHISLAQREQAQSLAAVIRAKSDAERSARLAATDLEFGVQAEGTPVSAVSMQPSNLPRAIASIAKATSAATAASAASSISNGPWKLQLGAFSVAGNADRAWKQISGSSALTGKSKHIVPAGRLTRLLAGGWPSQGAAQSACNALKASGHACLVTR